MFWIVADVMKCCGNWEHEGSLHTNKEIQAVKVKVRKVSATEGRCERSTRSHARSPHTDVPKSSVQLLWLT